MKKEDLVGRAFGRWTVKGPALREKKATMWWCQCQCGTLRAVSAGNLKMGKSTSCGCYREEVRPTHAKRRDFWGANNPKAKASIKANGDSYVESGSVWYKRAAGVMYAARKAGAPFGFPNISQFAAYLQRIAPATCPVFGVPFAVRGAGFSRWSPSADKIIPALGYVEGNIQVISTLANCMKRDASPEELRRFAQWILKEK